MSSIEWEPSFGKGWREQEGKRLSMCHLTTRSTAAPRGSALSLPPSPTEAVAWPNSASLFPVATFAVCAGGGASIVDKVGVGVIGRAR